MKRIRKTLYRDAMNTLEGWAVEFSPEERQRHTAHGGDLIKSGLFVDYFRAMDKESGPTFSDNVARMKCACADHLEELGLPDPGKRVVQSTGGWRYASEGFETADLAPGEKLSSGDGPCRDDAEEKPLSDAWFFFKIYELCLWFQTEKDTEMRYELAARIGEIRTLFETRREHMKGVTRGAAVLDGANAGADARRDKLAPQTLIRLIEMRRLIGSGHSVKRAAELAADKGLGKSLNANRALWYRHNPI